jgi:ATP-binding cassette, subfamily B, bacterial
MKYYAHSVGMRPEITLFGLKNWVVEQYQKASIAIAQMEEPVDPNSLPNRIWNWMTEFGQTTSRASMYLLVALRPGYFKIPLSELTYLEQNAQQLFLKTFGIWRRVGYVFHDMMAIQELFECMEMQPNLRPPVSPAGYESETSAKGTGMKIEFRNVSYKYPSKPDFVLKDVSFVLEAGETLALLGYNGSGKSADDIY